MLHFKAFIVIIFTAKIVETNVKWFKYEAGVTGTIFCRHSYIDPVVIYISKKLHLFKEINPISRKVVQFGKYFCIYGKVKNWKRPRLFIKIFYRCSKEIYPNERMFMEEIPRQYIFRRGKFKEFFNFGQMEMSSQTLKKNISSKRYLF